MTATETLTSTIPVLAVEAAPLEDVAFDIYRNIHKGIRNEMFAVAFAAGAVDPGQGQAVAAVAERWRNLSGLLVSHAQHEEDFVHPVLEQHAPGLAARVVDDHHELDARAAALEVLAERAADACDVERRLLTHRVYLGLAGFVSAYLVHQELEELEVMPALAAVVGPDELLALDMQIVASLTPEEIVQSGTLMLPAMNIEDRVELVGGMKAAMPPEAFAGMWQFAASVLGTEDTTQLAARIGVA